MILSSELNAQLERFSKTRSCSLNSELKNELAMVLFDINGKRLNKSCGTCVRNAMQDVLNFIAHEVRLESFIGVRHEKANAIHKAQVKGDTRGDVTDPVNGDPVNGDDTRQAADLLAKLDRMTYKELKAYAGVKGNIKREKIYELIHLSK